MRELNLAVGELLDMAELDIEIFSPEYPIEFVLGNRNRNYVLKWKELYPNFQKVAKDLFIIFPYMYNNKYDKELKDFKELLVNLSGYYYLTPYYNKINYHNCFYYTLCNEQVLQDLTREIELDDNEFYFGPLGIVSIEKITSILDRIRSIFTAYYVYTPRYIVEQNQISDKECEIAKSSILALGRTNPNVELIIQRELESSIIMHNQGKLFLIRISHAMFLKDFTRFSELLINPKKNNTQGLKCTLFKTKLKVEMKYESIVYQNLNILKQDSNNFYFASKQNNLSL